MAITSSDEAVPAFDQHTTPCHDCPWRRQALPGWLGGSTVEDWLLEAHSDATIPCHVYSGAQCAGSAIYRRNVAKNPRDPEVLVLGVDKITVFANPSEFREHHEGGRPSVSAPAPESVSDAAPNHVEGVGTMAKTNNDAVTALKAKHAEVVAKLQEKADKKNATLVAKNDKKFTDILQTVGKLSEMVQALLAMAGAFASTPKAQKTFVSKAEKALKLCNKVLKKAEK